MTLPRFLLLAAMLWLSGTLHAAEPEAVAVGLQDSLIDAMKSSRPYPERVAAVSAAVDTALDVEQIARLSLGRHWRELPEARRQEFVRIFRELTVASFASRFTGHRGERFGATHSEPLPRGGTAVTSDLHRPGKEPVAFEYQLRKRDGVWRIVNILVDGISDLALKRAEYNRLMDEGGFEKLTDELRRQIESLEASAE